MLQVLVLHPRFGEDLNELRLRQSSKKLPSAVGAEITLKILVGDVITPFVP